MGFVDNAYYKALEKLSQLTPEKIEARKRKIYDMHKRAQRLSRLNDAELRLENNPNTSEFYVSPHSKPIVVNHLPDPVSDALYGIIRSVGESATTYTGLDEYTNLRLVASNLNFDISMRRMKETTYNALLDGTHPIYGHARALGIDMKPGIVEKTTQAMEDV